MLIPLDDPSRLRKPGEVALILRGSRKQIYRRLRTGLRAIRSGGGIVRIFCRNLWKFIDDHKNLIG